MVALPSILAFNPDDELAAAIIRDLAEPGGSLDSVASARGIAVADLALWLTTPAARERMLAIEQGGCAHVRMAASLHLSRAVAALLRVLDTFNALAASRPADDPLVIRAAIHANKAAYHLYRLSRIVPIDDSRTLGSLAPRARAHADSSQRTASVSERTLSSSDSWLPSQPVHPAGALRKLPLASSLKDDANSTASVSERAPSEASPPSPTVHPAGALHDLHPTSSLKTDADSPRAIEVGGSASTSMSSPASSSAASAPPSPTVHPAGALHDLHPAAVLKTDADSLHPTSSLMDDVDSLNVQLDALARALGLDTSDIDENAPLPPEFLATLPPELAAFLSETDPLHADPTSRPAPNSWPDSAPTPEPVGASP